MRSLFFLRKCVFCLRSAIEIFYNGWKQENPTRDNCRFGASRDELFPPDRQVQLDVNYLKKMGLTRQRKVKCDALFFYQSLLPICDPTMSGINDDPRMTYYDYEKVATNTNMYAYGVKKRGGKEFNKDWYLQGNKDT